MFITVFTNKSYIPFYLEGFTKCLLYVLKYWRKIKTNKTYLQFFIKITIWKDTRTKLRELSILFAWKQQSSNNSKYLFKNKHISLVKDLFLAIKIQVINMRKFKAFLQSDWHL